MNLKKISSVLASAALVIMLGTPASALAGGKTSFQVENFHDFPGGTVDQPSAGTLTRTKQSIHANLALSGLDLGAAYTVWWVIWNNPSKCAGTPCGLGDLGVSGNAVIYATGFVTGESGATSVTADLMAGKIPDGMVPHPDLPGVLKRGNGLGVEAHMLVQSHGSILPGSVDIQITIDLGACNPDCTIQQAIAFLP